MEPGDGGSNSKSTSFVRSQLTFVVANRIAFSEPPSAFCAKLALFMDDAEECRASIQ
jgi:hypothetical protein